MSPTPGPGGEADFTVYVANHGTGTATNVNLQIQLPAGARLTGAPAYDRGTGCTGLTTVECFLDFLPPGTSSTLRFGMLTVKGVTTINLAVSSSEVDADPSDTEASLTMRVGQFS